MSSNDEMSDEIQEKDTTDEEIVPPLKKRVKKTEKENKPTKKSKTSKKTDTETSKKTDTDTSKKTDTETSKKKDTETSKKKDTETSKKKDTETSKKTDTESSKKKDTDTETETTKPKRKTKRRGDFNPTTKDMITDAINNLEDNNYGSSVTAIKTYIFENFKVNEDRFKTQMKRAMIILLRDNTISRPKGQEEYKATLGGRYLLVKEKVEKEAPRVRPDKLRQTAVLNRVNKKSKVKGRKKKRRSQ